MSTTPAPTGTALRASDAERAATAERLHRALGAGRLDLAETDERVAAAYAARHRHELDALLTDLPVGDLLVDHAAAGAAPSWPALWVLAVWRTRSSVLGAATPRPSSAQLRSAVLLTALAVVWVAVWAVVGALMVGA